MQILFISSLIAAVFLAVYIFISGKWRIIKTITVKDFIELSLLGFIGNFLYSALYYASLKMLPASDACVINYLWPVIAIIFSCILLHEKITFRLGAAIAVSFIGVILISTKGGTINIGGSFGSIICILAAVCYGLFNVLNKKKNFDQYISVMIYFTISAIFSGAYMLFTDSYSHMSLNNWIGISWMGIFIDALAVLSWALALQNGKIVSLANIAYATPVLVMILSRFMLNEKFEIYSATGMCLVLLGLLIQNCSFNKKDSLPSKYNEEREFYKTLNF